MKSWRSVSIHDDRGKATRGYRYDDREAALYELCADARTREELRAAVDGDDAWLERTLAGFVARDLMLCLDDRYLALALPDNPYH